MGVPLVGDMVFAVGIGMGVVLDVRAARLKHFYLCGNTQAPP